MDQRTVRANRAAWEEASAKHVRENGALLAEARRDGSLTDVEREVLAPLLRRRPRVVHLQSGNGLDDLGLAGAGARRVIGIDYSSVATAAAAGRAATVGAPCSYVVAILPPAPLTDRCADLVYTGKGALMWMPDLRAWAEEAARLLLPGGHLFIYEAHPMVPLYDWGTEVAALRPDRGYFERQHVNDTYPARGAVEWQWTLGEIVTAVCRAGFTLEELREHPTPFWRPDGVAAAAWKGRLPNTFTLLARRT